MQSDVILTNPTYESKDTASSCQLIELQQPMSNPVYGGELVIDFIIF